MAQISFRLDDELKKAAEETFHSMGMTLTSAIHVFIAQTVREGQFPFPIKADHPHPVHAAKKEIAQSPQRPQRKD